MKSGKHARRVSRLRLVLFLFLCMGALYPLIVAFASGTGDEATGNAPGLTIYNQKFAVVRQKLPLELKSG